MLEVRWMASGNVACRAEVGPCTSVPQLKAQVFFGTGVSPAEQRLFSTAGAMLKCSARGAALMALEAVLLVRVENVARQLRCGNEEAKSRALSRICTETMDWIEHFLDQGCLPALFGLMWESQGGSGRAACGALDALSHILDLGSQKQARQGLLENPFAALVEQTAGWPLDEMLYSPSAEISGRARRILQRHWP